MSKCGIQNKMFALITGASSGIGLQYAIQLARDYHCDMLLVSNQQDELCNTAAMISEKFNVVAQPFFLDLSQDNAAQTLFEHCQKENLRVDILINNAGIFFFNEYIRTNMRRIETMLNVHMMTIARLCRLFGEQMCERRSGYILNMSSMSAWMAMPGIQTYNATKAFLYNFSKALWYEFKPYGVNILVMTPGAVDTELFGLSPRLRRVAVNLHVSITPEKLVKRALKKLFAGKKSDMPGVLNYLATPLLKHTPDWLLFLIMKYIKKYQK